MTEKKAKTKLVKVAPRKYRVVGVDEDGGELKEQVAPAEYAVEKDGERLASLVKTGDGWRVCQATEQSRLGLAISPVGMDGFRSVKLWALKRFA